ncbi:MAG: aminotransferase class V-fold PLP-dependent enzyme [Phycisphaeraceae bacterium]|nr:MAG: aminotransferase class V-fold PLP-dependent enzyme [Phycisphaeraceae bacterium]
MKSTSAAATPVLTQAPIPEPRVGGFERGRVSFFARHWDLDPGLTFLNHGSYGAVPRVVAEEQARLRSRVERDPVRFYKADLEPLMDGMRGAVGRFVNCPPGTIAPMVNATVAIATILHQTAWREGDEVLVTDHEYMSGLNELSRLGASRGVRTVTAHVPFPGPSAGDVLASLERAITPRTRMMMVSWITSATSLVFPIREVVALGRSRGITVLVDGTHAPGQVPVDIAGMDPDYFVGSFHKWVSAPKGTGFLYVPERLQEGFRTICLSSRAHKVRPERALFLRDSDYMGTDDYTAILSVPSAVRFFEEVMPGGWPAVMAHNHDLVLKGREIVLDALETPEPAPATMIGTMATVVLPEAPASLAGRPTVYDDPIQDALVERHGCVAPVWRFMPSSGPHAGRGLRVLRLSAQVYNTLDDYHRMASALSEELDRERRGG